MFDQAFNVCQSLSIYGTLSRHSENVDSVYVNSIGKYEMVSNTKQRQLLPLYFIRRCANIEPTLGRCLASVGTKFPIVYILII